MRSDGRKDHCRIGSLENKVAYVKAGMIDHCRIGSLEIINNSALLKASDHCRIGSLETIYKVITGDENDHCRIGSLEMHGAIHQFFHAGSLPHRQLRNPSHESQSAGRGSLPHRQLRKREISFSPRAIRLLPREQKNHTTSLTAVRTTTHPTAPPPPSLKGKVKTN